MGLSCPLGTTRCVPRENYVLYAMYPLFPFDQAVGQDGWLLASFLCVNGPRLRLIPITRKNKNLTNTQPS